MKTRLMLLIVITVALFGVAVQPSQAAGPYTITLSMSITDLVAGQLTSVSSTITDGVGAPVPSGTIQLFVDGTENVGASFVNGQVTFDWIFAAIGAHQYQARYCGEAEVCGDADDAYSNSIPFTVNKANTFTQITLPKSMSAGHPANIAITVTPALPANNSYCATAVQLVSTDNYLGDPVAVKLFSGRNVPLSANLQNISGTCSGKTFITKTFSAGTYTITVTYPGSPNHNSSQASITFTVPN
jgi:hypothetical protein